jgi:hypothetical protein
MWVRPWARESCHPRNPLAPPDERSTALEAPAHSAVSKTAKPTVSDCFLAITTIFVIRKLDFAPLPTLTGTATKRTPNNVASLLDADAKHPERFVRKFPTSPG